ncbi:MAG: hypothetical protein ACTSX4_11425 [Candidatus Helarchaeota archaeon]
MEKVLEKVLNKFVTKFTTNTNISQIMVVNSSNNILYNSFSKYQGSPFELQKHLMELMKINREFLKSERKETKLQDVLFNYNTEQFRVHITENNTIIIFYNDDKNLDLSAINSEILDFAQKIEGIVLSQEVFLGKSIIDLDSDIENLEMYEKAIIPPSLDIKKLFRFIQ